jgi:hypothetical protein
MRLTNGRGALLTPNRIGGIGGIEPDSLRFYTKLKAGTFGGGNGLSSRIYFTSLGEAAVTEAYLRYYVQFPLNLSTQNKGGKLPGLGSAGSFDASGGSLPNGTDGWSMRLMWRGGDTYQQSILGPCINLYAYPYLIASEVEKISAPYDWEGAFGGYVPLKNTLENQTNTASDWFPVALGIPHKIEQRVRLNTPGIANGVFEVWVNDVKLFSRWNIMYRTVDNVATMIGSIFLHAFRGGNDSAWATDRDETILLDYVKIGALRVPDFF